MLQPAEAPLVRRTVLLADREIKEDAHQRVLVAQQRCVVRQLASQVAEPSDMSGLVVSNPTDGPGVQIPRRLMGEAEVDLVDTAGRQSAGKFETLSQHLGFRSDRVAIRPGPRAARRSILAGRSDE